MTELSNPLLEFKGLPPFSKIKPKHVKPAIEQAIANCKAEITRLLAENSTYTWQNLIAPIEETEDVLENIFAPVYHMNSVVNTDELRKVFDECLPLLSDYSTWQGQHKDLFKAYQAIKESDQFVGLEQAQKKTIENALRGFKLSGINLPTEQQKRFGKIDKKGSELSSKFTNNVLDATMAWSKHITNVADLAGMPQSSIDAAEQAAKAKNLDGYLLTLDFPSFSAVIKYCDNQEIRKEIYEANITKASDLGPNANEFNNDKLIDEILAIRDEKAKMLGFKNYSEKSLATKMAENPAQVFDFLNNLAEKVKPQGEQEVASLKEFMQKEFSISELNPWDLAYYAEKQQQHLFNFSEDDLRQYFPEDKVVSGLFEVLNRLYDITIKQHKDVDTWHKDVKFFEIFDKDDSLLGSFYMDLYARNHKRGGAWMTDCKTRRIKLNGKLQTPITFLTCNFNKPVGDKPALFTHNEVTTLFHEMGHGVHHMLTKVNTSSVSGTNGVSWDAVELPSQFLENWCWQEEALQFISGHYETGKPLPKEMLDRMLEAKNFQSGLFVLRQLRFGLFDMTLHTNYKPEQNARMAEVLAEVDAKVSILPAMDWDRHMYSFSHIFGGGYAAGYYSYLWAEVLSADAFSRFEEEGIFNKQTGQDFLHNILEMGGSEEPLELFKRFRGRAPQPEAMLRHKGITG